MGVIDLQLHLPLHEVGSVLSHLCRWLSGPAVASDDARHHLIRYAEERFGKPLLASRSVDELDAELDQIIGDGRFLSPLMSILDDRTLVELKSLFRSPDALRFPELAAVRARLVPATHPLLESCEQYSLALVDALRDLDEHYDIRENVQDVATTDMLSFWADPMIPPVVARGNEGSLRAALCMMALAQDVAAGGTIAPWLVEALLQRWRDGLRAYLIVLASMPGVAVDESIVPPNDLVDLEDAVRRTLATKAHDDELLRQAREAGAAVHPLPEG